MKRFSGPRDYAGEETGTGNAMPDQDPTPSIEGDLRSTIWEEDCNCEVHLGVAHDLKVNWRHDCPLHGPELSERRAATAAIVLEPLDHEYLRFYRRIGASG